MTVWVAENENGGGWWKIDVAGMAYSSSAE
jgi:hypothetical protein